jgi:hypothetical protein
VAEILCAEAVIPAHLDGWAHFSEGIDDVVTAFDEAGIAGVLAVGAAGEWIQPERLISWPSAQIR